MHLWHHVVVAETTAVVLKKQLKMTTDAGTDQEKNKAAAAKGVECGKMIAGKSEDEIKEIAKDCLDAVKK